MRAPRARRGVLSEAGRPVCSVQASSCGGHFVKRTSGNLDREGSGGLSVRACGFVGCFSSIRFLSAGSVLKNPLLAPFDYVIHCVLIRKPVLQSTDICLQVNRDNRELLSVKVLYSYCKCVVILAISVL